MRSRIKATSSGCSSGALNAQPAYAEGFGVASAHLSRRSDSEGGTSNAQRSTTARHAAPNGAYAGVYRGRYRHDAPTPLTSSHNPTQLAACSINHAKETGAGLADAIAYKLDQFR
jgi:hypothetical protein